MKRQKFCENVNRYKNDLYIVAGAILHNQADAEDAVSNAILKGYEKLDQLKNPRKFKAWMLTITKNEALKIKEKRLHLPGNDLVESMLEPVQDSYDELWDVIQLVKEEYRLVLVLFYYQDLSLKDIAEVLNIPTGTVKSRLNRGREQLKSILEERENDSKRVDEVLKSIPEEENQMKKGTTAKKIIGMVVVVLIVGGLILAHNSTRASANIFTTFTKTIMDFFSGGDEKTKEAGVTSDVEEIQSKPDLMVSMKERIIDRQNMYLLISIEAPTTIEFNEKMGFEYFGFFKGDNYNEENLLGGAINCKLLEVKPGEMNKAIYIASISSDENLKEDTMVTFFMKNLQNDPNSEAPQTLVEGMWSVTFPIEFTTKENVVIKGNDEMKFPFLEKEAMVKNIKISSLGMSIMVDVSQVPYDDLGISDTTVGVRLQMLDGSEVLVMSHNFEDDWAVNSSSHSYSQKKGKTYQKCKYEFKDALDTSKVLGVYIEDLYIPVKNLEME